MSFRARAGEQLQSAFLLLQLEYVHAEVCVRCPQLPFEEAVSASEVRC